MAVHVDVAVEVQSGADVAGRAGGLHRLKDRRHLLAAAVAPDQRRPHDHRAVPRGRGPRGPCFRFPLLMAIQGGGVNGIVFTQALSPAATDLAGPWDRTPVPLVMMNGLPLPSRAPIRASATDHSWSKGMEAASTMASISASSAASDRKIVQLTGDRLQALAGKGFAPSLRYRAPEPRPCARPAKRLSQARRPGSRPRRRSGSAWPRPSLSAGLACGPALCGDLEEAPIAHLPGDRQFAGVDLPPVGAAPKLDGWCSKPPSPCIWRSPSTTR